MFGPVCENGVWRSRYNDELYSLYGEADIVKDIKISRLRWPGHVIRTGKDNILYKIYNAKPWGTRRRGRPLARWTDNVAEDGKKAVNNWWSVARDRSRWRLLLETAKARPGLF